MAVMALVGVGVGALGLIQRQRALQVTRANATVAARNGNSPAQILALSMDSASDGWVVESGNARGPTILHITFGAAVAQPPLQSPGFAQPGLQALSPTDAWLLLGQISSSFYHYDGHAWVAVTIPLPGDAAPNTLTLEQFFMRSPADGWAIGTYEVNGGQRRN